MLGFLRYSSGLGLKSLRQTSSSLVLHGINHSSLRKSQCHASLISVTGGAVIWKPVSGAYCDNMYIYICVCVCVCVCINDLDLVCPPQLF